MKKNEFGLARAQKVITATNNASIDFQNDEVYILDLLQIKISSIGEAKTEAQSIYSTDTNTNSWVGVKWQNQHGLVIINWYNIVNGIWPVSPDFTESAGGSGSDVLPRNYNGTDEVVSFDVSSVQSVNSDSAAKSLVEGMINDWNVYDEDVWVGIKWTYGYERNYVVGTGNGGARIYDRMNRSVVDWYRLDGSKSLIFQYQDRSTY